MARTTHPVLRALTPEPHRGDQVAAGVVVLATLVLLVDVRFAGVWSSAARLVVTGLAAAFVGTMAARSPLESDRPRAFQTVLYVTTTLLTLLALIQLRGTLDGGGSSTSAGAITWISLAAGLLALTFATARNSAYCTLVAAIALGVCALAAVTWIFDAHGSSTYRWILLLIVLAYLLGAVMLRDRRRRHAVMLADAAGLAVLVLALLLTTDQGSATTTVLSGGVTRVIEHTHTVSWGWLFVIFAAGCGLVAYAGADREPGPGYFGVACLGAFALVAGGNGDATLLGWPLVLAVIAGAFLVLGLRPSRPLPPEPEPEVEAVTMALPVPPLRDATAGEPVPEDDPEEF